jgi:site-specific DNA recombinase
MSPEQIRRRGGRPRKIRDTVQEAPQGPVRAVGYIRVSTIKQTDGTSLETQHEAIRAYARSQGWELAEIYTDEGVSGSKAERPGLDAMMANLEGVHRVIVLKLDRLGRSAANMLKLYDQIEALGASIVSIKEHVDTSTALGRLMRTLLVAMAEMEREMIAERTQSGREARAKQGAFLGGKPPFGYQVVASGNVRRFEIYEPEAVIVRDIFKMRHEQELSLQAIANTLNTGGVEPPAGNTWHPTTVRNILENPIHRGRAVWGRRGGQEIESQAPAIIAEVI